MNSKVSKQWLLDRYAMNAASVHGGSAVFANISLKLGRRGQYGPCMGVVFGIATERGLDGGISSVDIDSVSSSSVSDPAFDESAEGRSRKESRELEVDCENSDDGFRTTITFWKSDRLPFSKNAGLRRFEWICTSGCRCGKGVDARLGCCVNADDVIAMS